jgi:hypothetical protein
MKVQKKEKQFEGYEYPMLMHNPSYRLGSAYYIILAIGEEDLNIEGTILYSVDCDKKYVSGYHSKIFAKPLFEPYDGEIILSN